MFYVTEIFNSKTVFCHEIGFHCYNFSKNHAQSFLRDKNYFLRGSLESINFSVILFPFKFFSFVFRGIWNENFSVGFFETVSWFHLLKIYWRLFHEAFMLKQCCFLVCWKWLFVFQSFLFCWICGKLFDLNFRRWNNFVSYLDWFWNI